MMSAKRLMFVTFSIVTFLIRFRVSVSFVDWLRQMKLSLMRLFSTFSGNAFSFRLDFASYHYKLKTVCFYDVSQQSLDLD